jgi:hypothetical protein
VVEQPRKEPALDRQDDVGEIGQQVGRGPLLGAQAAVTAVRQIRRRAGGERRLDPAAEFPLGNEIEPDLRPRRLLVSRDQLLDRPILLGIEPLVSPDDEVGAAGA